MNFSRVSDAIPLHHISHRDDGYDGDEGLNLAPRGLWLHFVTDAGDAGGALVHSSGPLAGPAAHFASAYVPTHEPGTVQSDHPATGAGAMGGQVGNPSATSPDPPAVAPASGGSHPGIATSAVESGANTAGNGGDGFFYGGIVHASLLIYEPINIAVALGYGSVALANQTNDLNVDQSAFQMAGIGGGGGNGNLASGGNVTTSAGSDVIATGGNGAGNGGNGSFFGTLLDAPVVIYHPVNIAIAGSGGTAHANQFNAVEIDQSATQVAGVGGNGGNGNAAAGGSIITLDPGWGSSNGGSAGSLVQTGGNQAGDGGDGSFYGGLVHTSVVVYDPVNIAVAGYNSSSYAAQTNNVYVDQSAVQVAGIGGDGGNGNVAMGGGASLVSHGLWGGSDAIATGSNGAGNGGSGHFAGSLVDLSFVIYAPINIAIAGAHATAEADQINNVHIDQSAVQMAGIGGNGGHGNFALGGEFAQHLLSDIHLTG